MDPTDTAVFQKNVAKLTTRPGVYLYFNGEGNVIYVGKAKNLRARVRQYFTHDDAVGQKTSLLVSQISSIEIIPTDCEFDALLLESVLIRKYQPKYNAIAKDDKSPLYIAITFDEALPRVLYTRKTTIDSWGSFPKQRFIAGPFQSGRVARLLMQSVRRIIPYCTQKRRDGRPCFYTHIGLCKPCPSQMSKIPPINRERKRLTGIYRGNFRRIALLLSGHARSVRMQLEHAMRKASEGKAFEQAGEYKDQLDALDRLLTHGFDPMVYTDGTGEPTPLYATRLKELTDVLTHHGVPIQSLARIECIDISSLQGQWATGSLVVFVDGLPNTDEYRRFRIKAAGKPNDVGMMAEVIKRRFSHPEWQIPNLLVVDGGKPQVKAAQHALVEGSLVTQIPVIGLAKRFEEIVIPLAQRYAIIHLAPASPAIQILQHIRDEAHRFAKRYHTILRSRLV